MKRQMLTLGFTVLLIGMLLAGCGAAGDNPINEPVNSGNGDASVPDEGLPDVPQEDGPIINLPGEVPFQEQDRDPGQAQYAEGQAFVLDAQLLVMESYPVQISLQVSGELPTPCNLLTIDISEPNADNQINIKVYSLVDPAMTCIAMIEPFDTAISLPVADLADGTYEVWVNGTLVGEFSFPG